MKRGDVVIVNLPLVPNNRAQGGRRPAILVIADNAQQNNPMAMIVPLTTTPAATRFPFTLTIQPASQNGLTAVSIALVFQLMAADSTKLESVIGTLEPNYLQAMDIMMRTLLNLP